MFDKIRKPVMLVMDLAAVNASIFLSFSLRFDWVLTREYMYLCLYFMAWASVIKIILFSVFGLYQWSFRYASISEATNILKATTIGSLLLIAVAFFTEHIEMGRSVLLIDYIFCLFFISNFRFLPRVLIKLKQLRCKNLKRTLIIGAGSAGVMVVREMVNAKIRLYNPVGFIDDNPAKLNLRIQGIRVLGKVDNIASIAKDYNVEEIIIAIPSANGKTMRDVISKCERTGIKIKTIPGLHKILTGETSIKQIRDVSPEDLLGRQEISIDIKISRSFIKNKVVLITGSGGSIGSELCRQIAKFDPRFLVLYDYNENDSYFLKLELCEAYPGLKLATVIGDVKDAGLLKHTFSLYKPDIVFHSAAHKHVPLMEENPAAAIKNNVIGTRNVMDAAEHYKADSFVLISTDKAVNPTSAMGASKRIAEMMLQAKAKSANTKFMAVRFGNVIGSSGSVVPIFKKQIEKGKAVTITHPEVKRFFMTASEAAQLVIQASAIGKGGEIFILDMGEQVKILDLARNLIILSGLEPYNDIEIKFTGLRPGEKMHEEMLLNVEHDRSTKVDKVYIAQPYNFDITKLRKDIEDLERLSGLMAEKEVMKKIKEIVPLYNPAMNGKSEPNE